MQCRPKRMERFPGAHHGRSTLRVVLVLVLGLGTVVLLLDVRARRSSTDADTKLTELTSREIPGPIEVQGLLKRKPTSTREVSGGLIEAYEYGPSARWVSYAIRVAYAQDAELQMRYLDHNFNEAEGEFRLEGVIAAHQYRLLHPPGEETEYAEGPMEVGLSDVYTGVQSGGRLDLAYDAEAGIFAGSLENATRDSINGVRVTVRLSNGEEVGPVLLGDIESGSRLPVELKTDSTDFTNWTAYVENDLFLNESYEGVRQGAEVVLAYDSEMKAFKGTVKNTTTETIDAVRIAVRVSNGAQVGPAVLENIPPETEVNVELKAGSEDFNAWSVQTAVE